MTSSTSEGFQTYTFLFSDIEGSTRLWEALPEPMRLALREHDACLTHVFASHDGEVFKTIGDAFCVAFTQVSRAVEAALALQQGLRSLEVAQGQPLRVRVSVHTGLAERRDGDYFGPALNRVARQLGVAHGGQVLVSQATELMLGQALPAGAHLLSLGKQRLRDLEHLEVIYQLCHPDLLESFPPLRSATEIPNNLPEVLTAFIGREAERQAVKALLASHRLVTLAGPGGIGKTRLALQSISELLAQFPDGAFFLDLAPLSDPKTIPQLLLTTLGLEEHRGHTALERLVEFLRSRKLLLLWDNIEHLLDGCAELIVPLLRYCPDLRILTTSLEPLGISGEQVLRVPAFDRVEATQFFVDRAVLHQSSFVGTPEALESIGRICQRLDGIPLALELAAARVRVLSPQQIEARLEDVFRLLTGTNRRALPRQQTLRALIDWSYSLLNEKEKRLLQRLSVFVGGWTLEAAEAICHDDTLEEIEVVDLLTALVEKSLVVVEETGAEYRYRLLEVLRQYSQECLQREETPEQRQQLRDAHTLWFARLARAAPGELHGAQQGDWIKRLEQEHDNLRSAQDNGGAAAVGITADLCGFWRLRGYLTEGRRRLNAALESYPEGEPALRTRLLAGAAQFAGELGDYGEASQLQQQCLTLAQGRNNTVQAAWCLVQLGILATAQGQLDSARSYYHEGIALFREKDELRGVAWALNILGRLDRQQGYRERAHEHFHESLTLQRRLGTPENIAACLINLGQLEQDQGAFERARLLYEEALLLNKELGNTSSMAAALHNLGVVARCEREWGKAQRLLREALALVQELGDPQFLCAILIELSATLLDEGQPDQGTPLLVECGTRVRQYHFPLLATELLELWARLHLVHGEEQRARAALTTAEALRLSLGKVRSPWAQSEYQRLAAALDGIAAPEAQDWEQLLRDEEAWGLTAHGR